MEKARQCWYERLVMLHSVRKQMGECWGRTGFPFPFVSFLGPHSIGQRCPHSMVGPPTPCKPPQKCPHRHLEVSLLGGSKSHQVERPIVTKLSWTLCRKSVTTQYEDVFFFLSLFFSQMYTSSFAKPCYHGCYSFIVNLKSGRNI